MGCNCGQRATARRVVRVPQRRSAAGLPPTPASTLTPTTSAPADDHEE